MQESQRAILMESLDDANGFRDTADPATYARCERSIKQIHHSLERLAKVWAVSQANPMMQHQLNKPDSPS